MSGWQEFGMDTVGLRGKRLRLVTDDPRDYAGIPQDLPSGVTDVIAADDDVTIYATVRVHPVGDPNTFAQVRYDQLALYDDQL